MTFYHRALLLAAIFATSLPSTAKEPSFVSIPRELQIKEGSPQGLVFGTIGVTDPFGYGVKALFRRVGSKAHGFLVFDYRGASKAEFSSGQAKSKLVYFELPLGHYEFYGLNVETHEASTATYISARRVIPIGFEVVAGRSTYLGELRAEAIFEPGSGEAYQVAGTTAHKGRMVGAFFRVSDLLTRDAAALQAIEGGQGPADVINASLNFAAAANPLFVWQGEQNGGTDGNR
jgi:hypothetical protein